MQKIKNFSNNENDFIAGVIKALPQKLKHLGHRWPNNADDTQWVSNGLVNCLDCLLLLYIDYNTGTVLGPATSTCCPFPEPTEEAHLYSEYNEVGFLEGILSEQSKT